VYLALLDTQLSGRDFFLGAAPCISDFALYHPMWFIERGTPSLFEPYPSLVAWMKRIASLGHGRSTEISSRDAIDICRASGARELPKGFAADPNGITPGTPVIVRSADIARDPIEGELAYVANDEIAITRRDPRAGEVVVHFPRIGYELSAR
jgi:hypothetical protein